MVLYKRNARITLKTAWDSLLPDIVVNSPGTADRRSCPILSSWVSTMLGCHE